MIAFSISQSPSLRDVQAVSSSLADVALSDNVQQLRRIAADMRTYVRGIARDLTEHRRAARSVPPVVTGATDEEIDAAVSELLRQERSLREAWERTVRLCRKIEAKARHLRPTTYPLARQITSTAESWYRPYLRFLRDLRWEIMALQADRVPDATGPIVANASDLDAYFRSMPPAA
jgi:hypothetical protein